MTKAAKGQIFKRYPFTFRTGEKLLLAKAQCNHGEFGTWLKENCTVSQRYANQFMKLATDMPELLTSNWNSSSNLGLKQALELLSVTDEVKEQVLEKIEAGETVTIAEIQRLKKEVAEWQQSASDHYQKSDTAWLNLFMADVLLPEK